MVSCRSSRKGTSHDHLTIGVPSGRLSMLAASGIDLGSLKQFVDRRKFKDVPWTDEQEKEQRDKEDAFHAKKAQDAALLMAQEVEDDNLEQETMVPSPPSRPQTVPTVR